MISYICLFTLSNSINSYDTDQENYLYKTEKHYQNGNNSNCNWLRIVFYVQINKEYVTIMKVLDNASLLMKSF